MASTAATSALRIRRAPALGLAAVASAIIVLATLATLGAGEEGLVRTNRHLARLAFFLFLLPYSASALATLWPSQATRELVRRRRTLGLSYAVAQLTHAATIVAMFVTTPQEAAPDVSLAVGTLGMLFVVFMAATSNDRSVRALGHWWKRLHTAGIWLLWFIYVFTYVGRVAERELAYAPLLGLALGAMLVRVAAALRRRHSAA